MIAVTKDQRLREQATFAYLTLASFQDGVGPNNAGLSDKDVRLMAAPPGHKLDPADPNDWREVLDVSQKLESAFKWNDQVEKDMARLQAKLDKVLESLGAASR